MINHWILGVCFCCSKEWTSGFSFSKPTSKMSNGLNWWDIWLEEIPFLHHDGEILDSVEMIDCLYHLVLGGGSHHNAGCIYFCLAVSKIMSCLALTLLGCIIVKICEVPFSYLGDLFCAQFCVVQPSALELKFRSCWLLLVNQLGDPTKFRDPTREGCVGLLFAACHDPDGSLKG